MREKFIIGVDVGGTKVEAALIKFSKGKNGLRADVEKQSRGRTARRAGNRELKEIINRLIGNVWQRGVEAVGIGVPGFTDDSGRVFSMTNLPGWKRENLSLRMRKKWGVPVFVGNDADCFALAESMFGRAKSAGKEGVIIGLTLGTGVGGGIIINGEIYKSKGRKGGVEIGHMVIDPSGPRCRCGMKGCFESWCSGRAIEKIYRRISGKRLRAEDIGVRGSMNERKAVKVASDKLATALAGLINALNPDYIAVGGGASNIPGYVEPALKKCVKMAFPKNAKCVTIYKTGLNSGTLGAACLALKGTS